MRCNFKIYLVLFGVFILISALFASFAFALFIPDDREIIGMCTKGFKPGNLNGDEKTDISDPIYLLNFLFSRGPSPELPRIPTVNTNKDQDGDGDVDNEDLAIYILQFFGRTDIDATGADASYNFDLFNGLFRIEELPEPT